MYEFNKVISMALGTQHTVALTLASADSTVPELNTSAFKIGAPSSQPAAEPEPAAAQSEPKILSQHQHSQPQQHSQHMNGENGNTTELPEKQPSQTAIL